MGTSLTIKIKKRSLSGWCIWLLIMLPFMFGTMNELLGIPWAIRYVLDFAWMALLGMNLLRSRFRRNWRAGSLQIWVLLFVVYTFLVYVLKYQSAQYYFWGVRNNFRFYAAFFLFASFLKMQDADDYMKLFDKIFWIDVAVSVIQFLFFELDGDSLGGIFGAESGSNGYTNMFFLIIVIKSIVCYLEKSESAGRCFTKCGAALVVAAMAELKFFFMEFILVIVLAVLFTRFSWRKFWVIVGGTVGIAVCTALLTSLFPSFSGWFSLEWLFSNAISDHGYTSSGDLNRLNAISRINELWLGDAGSRLFGLGLGNCDTSTFSFLNTPFFEQYGDMHYTWISYAFMYLECGWIGLFFYWGFFVLVYYRVCRLEKTAGENVVCYCRIARIMAVLCIVISVYNSTLRTEAAYMAYFMLAIPFALDKQCNCRKRTIIC